jgi:predicted nucleic acid-binding protein
MLVLDASVLVKLFRDEPDSAVAYSLVKHCADKQVAFLSPGLALYELLSVALHYEVSFTVPIELVKRLRQTGFRLVEPSAREILKAEQIARANSPSHGFPQLKDSIYHAMAVERGATFVTADAKHLARTRSFGHITLLADWRPD